MLARDKYFILLFIIPMETNLMKVSIAKLWTSIQEVEIAVWATAMDALRKAGFNLDWIVSIKRNWTVIALDAALTAEDVLLVSITKVKGWLDEPTATETPVNVLKLSFHIVKENQPEVNGQVAFTDDMSTFDIIKQVMNSKGVSLNDFKEIKDAEGNAVTFSDKLVDGGSYKIVISDTPAGSEDEDDYEEDDS